MFAGIIVCPTESDVDFGSLCDLASLVPEAPTTDIPKDRVICLDSGILTTYILSIYN